MAGEDNLAAEYARVVLASSIGPDNVEHAPMRIAEARLTLGVVAARRGNLEEATALGVTALRGPRKSLPSLLMVAGELDVELERHRDHPVLVLSQQHRSRVIIERVLPRPCG